MRAIALLYHDVIRGRDFAASGFPGADADVYKLALEDFRRHLDALEASRPEGAGPVGAALEPGEESGLARNDARRRPPLLLTFDDGGTSAFPLTSDLLTAHGFTGHFFVTAGRIGTAGFLDPAAIRGLRAAGHVVGSHSFSHPPRMSRLSRSELLDEWRRSAERLAEILGESIRVASVPGGYYSRRVAESAAEAGIQILFNSEPVTRVVEVDGCRVLGRFTLRRNAPAEVAGALAAGEPGSRYRQWTAWNVRKLAKHLGGRHYIELKNALLRRRERRR